jgi:hypothetical protein
MVKITTELVHCPGCPTPSACAEVEVCNRFVKVRSDGGSTQALYGLPTGARDIDDLSSWRGMNPRIANIFKACWRIGRKEGNDDAYDLRKIIFAATRELERLEGKGL